METICCELGCLFHVSSIAEATSVTSARSSVTCQIQKCWLTFSRQEWVQLAKNQRQQLCSLSSEPWLGENIRVLTMWPQLTHMTGGSLSQLLTLFQKGICFFNSVFYTKSQKHFPDNVGSHRQTSQIVDIRPLFTLHSISMACTHTHTCWGLWFWDQILVLDFFFWFSAQISTNHLPNGHCVQNDNDCI